MSRALYPGHYFLTGVDNMKSMSKFFSENTNLFLLLIFVFLSVSIYIGSLQPIKEKFPRHNLNMPSVYAKIGGAREEDIAKWIDSFPEKYFVTPALFVFFLPTMPVLFAAFYPRKKSSISLFGKILLIIIGWIFFWEIFLNASNVLILQYFLEGFYISNSLFFGGIYTVTFFPIMIIASFVGSFFIFYIKRLIYFLYARKTV